MSAVRKIAVFFHLEYINAVCLISRRNANWQYLQIGTLLCRDEIMG